MPNSNLKSRWIWYNLVMKQEGSLSEKHTNFVEGLARSRVVQTIFEQMFRETLKYHVYPFGYEYTSSEMIDYRKDRGPVSKSFDKIRNQPDFRIYKDAKPRDVALVEVKYLSQPDDRFVDDAKALSEIWPGTYIFLATPNDFYMGTCGYVTKNCGLPGPLSECRFIANIRDDERRKIQAYHDILKKVLGIQSKLAEEPEVYNPQKTQKNSSIAWFWY